MNKIICAPDNLNWTEYSPAIFRFLLSNDDSIKIYQLNGPSFTLWLSLLGRDNNDITAKDQETAAKFLTHKLLIYQDELDSFSTNINKHYPERQNGSSQKFKLIYSELVSKRINSGQTRIFNKLYNPKRFNRLFTPRRVSIDLTYDCNLSCKHCYVQGKTDEFDKDIFLQMIGVLENAHIKKISFLGGEPFTLPIIDEVITECHNRGFEIDINTNGYHIDDTTLALIKDTKTLLVISLDGTEKNRSIRGEESYDHTLSTIEKCIAYGIEVRIAFTACRENYHQLPNVFRLASSIGATHFFLRTYSDTGDGQFLKFYQWHLLKFYRIYCQLSSIFMKINFSHTLTFGKCFARSTLNLSPAGDVRFCSLFHKDYTLGNITEEPLLNIWNSNNYAHKVNHANIDELCATCPLVNTCAEICRAESYTRFGDFYAGKKHCWKGKFFKYTRLDFISSQASKLWNFFRRS